MGEARREREREREREVEEGKGREKQLEYLNKDTVWLAIFIVAPVEVDADCKYGPVRNSKGRPQSKGNFVL